MRRISLLMLIAIVVTSCLEWTNRSHLNKLNRLIQTVDSLGKLKNEYFTFNADSLKDIRQELLQLYKTQNTPDTITIEAGQHIENIKYSYANLRLYTQHYSLFDTLQIKQKELKQLRAIISKGNGNRAEYANLVDEESKNVKNLQNNYQQLQSYYTEGIRNFEESERYLRELLAE